MSLAPRKPGFYIPLRKHISPDCKRDILFRRGTQIQAGDSLGAACYKRLIPAAKAKAVNHTRDIPQTFWRDDRLPWLELRSTWRSRQAYKRHSHPQLSVGAIIEGETRCLCAGQEYLLQPGDLIVIPPHAPHSCN
ncbi:AraC family ligand binding domain-containing protein, partial [Mycobacterium tuberculosis]|nr:AraC family ligand binding domain-containing protein [Mycobacterium tuberculosis]